VSAEALPYTLLILLIEFSVGSLAVLVAADARSLVVPSFVKLGAGMVLAGAALTLLTATLVEALPEVDGYPLHSSLVDPLRAVLFAFLVSVMAYNWFVWRGERRAHLAVGAGAALTGTAALMLGAYVVSAPTWGPAGPMLSLLAGSLAVGGFTMVMVWGHWYLVTPRLPSRPLEEMTLFLLAVLIFQILLMSVNAALPVREVPESQGSLGVGLAGNPAFWLRIGVGLVFPVVLTYMAWQSSIVRAMMSATGLLYIALGAVLAGEVLARGLLFVTAVPV
jgi:hypothetical protein